MCGCFAPTAVCNWAWQDVRVKMLRPYGGLQLGVAGRSCVDASPLRFGVGAWKGICIKMLRPYGLRLGRGRTFVFGYFALTSAIGVFFPIFGICQDVITDCLPFTVVTNNTFVIIALPHMTLQSIVLRRNSPRSYRFVILNNCSYRTRCSAIWT